MSRQAKAHATQQAATAKNGGGLLQRKCACGSRTTGGSECDGCRRDGSKSKRAAVPLQAAPTPVPQTGLTISAPGDAYELEADRVAERVMSTPAQLRAGGLARLPLRTARVDARAGDAADAPRESGQNYAPSAVDEVLRSPGKPLDRPSKLFMESRFGHDFSGVRVHTDDRAAESAREVDAAAYTVGRHIVFGAGRYRPGEFDGRKLLAHELAHVLQQGADASPSGLQRQDAGTRRRDAGPSPGARGDAGGVSLSTQPPSGPTSPINANLVSMNTTGTVDPADCTWRSRGGLPVAVPLGVWNPTVRAASPWRNRIQFVWRVNGVIGPGVSFDIKRVRGDATCERTSPGGPWMQVDSEPAGTPDDNPITRDECLTPQPPDQRIFSNDGPGFRGPEPRDSGLLGGGTLSPLAVAVRVRYTFEEWVEASIPGVGSNVVVSPRVPWHATISLDNTTTPPNSATWRRTPGEPNDIGAGAIALGCTGGASAPASPTGGTPTPASQTPTRPRR